MRQSPIGRVSSSERVPRVRRRGEAAPLASGAACLPPPKLVRRGNGGWGRGFGISRVGLPEKRLTIDSISRDAGVRPGLRPHASEEGAEGLCRTCS